MNKYIWFYFCKGSKARAKADRDGCSTAYIMDCYGNLTSVSFNQWSEFLAWSNIQGTEGYLTYKPV
jgi:hypothetical protein